MAAGLTTAKVAANFSATYQSANAISTPSDAPSLSQTNSFTPGTGANQANKLAYGQLTIPINTIVTIDLSALSDPFGASFSLVGIGVKGLYLQNTTTTSAGWIKVTPGGTHPWVVSVSGATYGLFNASTQGFYLGAGGVFAIDAPTDSFNVPDNTHCTIDLLGNPTVQCTLNYAVWG